VEKAERMDLPQLLDFYCRHLLEDVVPFWLKYAVDWDYGGLNTCIRDDGSIVSYDKYMWSQLRAIWTFSALYNRIERRGEWLDVARNVFEFASKYGRDDEGRWVFRCSRTGEILEGPTSIYADGFAIYGMTEYARATGDERAVKIALETFENVQKRLQTGDFKTAPYEVPPGAKVHGISMIFSLVFHELGTFLNDERIRQAALHHHREVMDNFRRPERKMLFEYVGVDNSLRLDEPWGRTIVPGHAIESMWFQIHIARDYGDKQRIAQACECINWHMELGWDSQYGAGSTGTRRSGGRIPRPFTHCCWPTSTAGKTGASTGTGRYTSTLLRTFPCRNTASGLSDSTGRDARSTRSWPFRSKTRFTCRGR